MIALIQRVSKASLTADGVFRGRIDHGLVALACAERDDSEKDADALAERVLNYRVFSDENGKMNLSLRDIKGQIMAVSQFTLAADTNSGNRPSFTPAAEPKLGEKLYERFVKKLEAEGFSPVTGVFGAHMAVELVNDGPVTFWLRYPKKR